MRFDSNYYVIKRNGQHQEVSTEKIETRIHRLSKDLVVDVAMISVKTAAGIFPGVKTSELDRLAAETAAYHSTQHPDYDKLAVRIAISNLHKQTQRTFAETMRLQYDYRHPRTKKHAPQISEETLTIAEKYHQELENAMHYERDFEYTFFGLRTLERSYLKKQGGEFIERIQHMLMRYIIGIHGDDLPSIFESYDLISRRIFTHATPTLFNSGTKMPQMSSCFLLTMDDSIDNIYDTLKRCAMLSKGAGGIGVSVSRIRATGSYIEGTDGESNGLVPMLRNFNATARYVDQCFTAETFVRVYSEDPNGLQFPSGKWKYISEIEESDLVIGKSGQPCAVKKILKHPQESKLVSLATTTGTVCVTEGHDFLAVRLDAQLRELPELGGAAWKDVVVPRLEAGLLKLEWIIVEELEAGDLIAHPLGNTKEEWSDYSFGRVWGLSDLGDVYTGPLYDLEVETDTSYCVAAGIAHNGGGKRKGAIAIYLEPWHADIEQFLMLKNNNGNEESRCRDLYYGLWVPDLFYKRVAEDGPWSLFCPNEAPGLVDCWGQEFEQLYLKYESTPNKARKVMPARKLMELICTAQIENAMPYMLNKDHCNAKSNHQHLGTITNSNLCTEIVQKCDPYQEVSVCNLATVSLPMCVNESKPFGFDFDMLASVTRHMVRNLNRVIDRNYYPIPESRRSNMVHRNIGVGVQGFHDAILALGLPYASKESKVLNEKIFATLYYAALDESCRLAEHDGPYGSFYNSPTSKGILQYDMWNVKPDPMWPWEQLKERINKFGLRNSLLIAPPPTASTSQILGNSESFEPYTSNIFVRSVLSGSFVILNKFLVRDLSRLGLWNNEMKEQIIAFKGSVQHIDSIPDDIKLRYKTAWEISNKDLIKMARRRGFYICQSHGLNVFLEQPTVGKFSAIHMYAWRKGLKTGMYYGHSRPATDGISFTTDHHLRQAAAEKMEQSVKRGVSIMENSDDSLVKRVKTEEDPQEQEMKDLENFVCVKGADCTSCQ